MSKQNRKQVNMNVQQYEILADHAESKGITLGEAIQEMQRDIDILKAHELNTISENAKMFCDQVDSLAECGRLPEWLVNAVKVTIRPIVLQGMVGNREIDLAGLRASWKIPQNVRFIAGYEKESIC